QGSPDWQKRNGRLSNRQSCLCCAACSREFTFDGPRLPSADWHIVRSIVMERDRYACTYCGSDKQLEADHILPLSRGGSNDFVNLATACRSCNLSKGSKAVEDWGAPGRLSPAGL